MKSTKFPRALIVPSKTPKTRNWKAWNNLMPPGPYTTHVHGEVQVANPGVAPALHRHSPQGINPTSLVLDLTLIQKPGIWPAIVVWKAVSYEEVVKRGYKRAEILSSGKLIKSLPVQDVF